MDLVGKWIISDETGLAESMKHLGIPQAFIDLSDAFGLQLEVTNEGDTFTIKQTANLLLSEYKCKPGQQFNVKNWLGQPLHGTVVVQSSKKMLENITEGNTSSVTTIQKVDRQKLIRTREIGEHVCSLTYTKL